MPPLTDNRGGGGEDGGPELSGFAQDLRKRVHFFANLCFRLHQVAGSDMYGGVEERLDIAVFLSPFKALGQRSSVGRAALS